MLGTGELIIVLVIVVMIFGAGKIPQLGRAIGEGIKNFKKATTDDAIDVTPKLEGGDKPEKKG
jgi:sec-independent protein translocase protein TatA